MRHLGMTRAFFLAVHLVMTPVSLYAAGSIHSEDFESDWSSGLWRTASGAAGCVWISTSAFADGGSFSASPLGGATCESDEGGPYDEAIDSWMYYGPFSLSDALTASVTFRHKVELESKVDWLHVGYSKTEFADIVFAWSWSPGNFSWTDGTLDLAPMVGESQVWIYFRMTTDSNSTADRGVFIDNISIDKVTDRLFENGFE